MRRLGFLMVGLALALGAFAVVTAWRATAPSQGEPALLPGLRSAEPAAEPGLPDSGAKYGGRTITAWMAAWPKTRDRWRIVEALREAPAAELHPHVARLLRAPETRERRALLSLLTGPGPLTPSAAEALAAATRDADAQLASEALEEVRRRVVGRGGRRRTINADANVGAKRDQPKHGYWGAIAEARFAVEELRAEVLQERMAQTRVAVNQGPASAAAISKGLAANRALLKPHAATLGLALRATATQRRGTLVTVLEQLGAPGVAAVDAAITSGAGAVRVEILRDLREHPELRAALNATIESLLNDNDPAVRRECAYLIEQGGTATKTLAGRMVQWLRSSDKQRQYDAASVLEKVEGLPALVLPELAAIAKADGNPTALLAVRAIGAAGKEARAALPALIAVARGSEAPETRHAAFEAIGNAGHMDQAVFDALVRGVEDPHPRPCEAAIKAMGAIGRPAVPALSWCLRHPRPAVQELAVWELDKIGEDALGVAPDLNAGLRAALSNPKGRWGAIRLLALNGEPAETLLPHIAPLLEDDTDYIRSGGLGSLAVLGAGARPMLEQVLERLADDSSRVRALAIWAAVHIAPEEERVLAALRGALVDPDSQARDGARLALRALGANGLPFLPDLLRGVWPRGRTDQTSSVPAFYALTAAPPEATIAALITRSKDAALPRRDRDLAFSLAGWLKRWHDRNTKK